MCQKLWNLRYNLTSLAFSLLFSLISNVQAEITLTKHEKKNFFGLSDIDLLSC